MSERFTGVTFVVPCGAGKLDHAAPAAELYTGSMFLHTLQAFHISELLAR